jgi:translocator protein
MRSFVKLGVSLLACYGAGAIGSLFMRDGLRGWYAALEKPGFMPPDWLFGVVWTALYALMGIALYLVWSKDPNASEGRGWVPLFFAHLLLNAAWTIFFFGFHAIFVALVDIILLFFAALLLIFGAREVDTRASWLLAPYAAWVAFAAVLNYQIWILN